MDFDFSGISVDVLEDAYRREVVSSSILVRAQKKASTLDRDVIPEEMNLLPPDLLDFMNTDDGDKAVLSACLDINL